VGRLSTSLLDSPHSLSSSANHAVSAPPRCLILSFVHPVLFHIGRVIIPSAGTLTAFGVLLALFLAQRTARIVCVDPVKIWNLCVLGLCAALAAERLLLVVVNWPALRSHPSWVLALATVHHPLLAGTGAFAALICTAWYARFSKLPFAATADALASPVALGLAFEQGGALMGGSGYGVPAPPNAAWAVTYTSPLAAIWSATPLGVPLHPVQLYAAMAWLALAVLLYVWLPLRRRSGDVAGLWLMGAGIAIYLTEIWRDPEGRGLVLHGALDGPQIAAIAMVLAGALILRERKSSCAPRQVATQTAPKIDEQAAS
jgi:phosphatidylglycerol---prolipoprotein diacylglyceryl transferase